MTTSTPDTETLVFLRQGTVAHVINAMDQDKVVPCRVCGRRPRPNDAWRGTGNMNEIERVSRMPRCQPPPSRWGPKEDT